MNNDSVAIINDALYSSKTNKLPKFGLISLSPHPLFFAVRLASFCCVYHLGAMQLMSGAFRGRVLRNAAAVFTFSSEKSWQKNINSEVVRVLIFLLLSRVYAFTGSTFARRLGVGMRLCFARAQRFRQQPDCHTQL